MLFYVTSVLVGAENERIGQESCILKCFKLFVKDGFPFGEAGKMVKGAKFGGYRPFSI
jgi:hypothetical protein